MFFMSFVALASFPDLSRALQSLFDPRFDPAIRRLVVLPMLEMLRQARHLGDPFGLVMRVTVPPTVSEFLHQSRWCVAEVQRYGRGEVARGVLGGAGVGDVDGVAFWRRGQIHDGLRERGVGLGHTEKVD